MSGLWWQVADSLGRFGILVFTFLGIRLYLQEHMFGGEAGPWAHIVWKWARRLFWVSFTLKWLAKIAMDGPLHGWDAAFLLLDIWNWWQMRNIDGPDDDWKKKLKDAATGTVERVGNRLKVAAPSAA